MDEATNTVPHHGVSVDLLRAQAHAAGLPLHTIAIPPAALTLSKYSWAPACMAAKAAFLPERGPVTPSFTESSVMPGSGLEGASVSGAAVSGASVSGASVSGVVASSVAGGGAAPSSPPQPARASKPAARVRISATASQRPLMIPPSCGLPLPRRPGTPGPRQRPHSPEVQDPAREPATAAGEQARRSARE